MSSLASSVWGGAAYPITQPFGCTTLTVEPYWAPCPTKHCHCGIDIGMGVGTPLYAARAGTVTYVGYGLLGIRAANGEMDWYVHIDRVADGISPFTISGSTVWKGRLVAYSGNKAPSGGSTDGPHLHFEVQTGNLNDPATRVDPLPILESSGEVEMLRLVGPGNSVYLLSGGMLVGLTAADNASISAAGVQAANVSQALIDAIKATMEVSVTATIPPLNLTANVTGTVKP